MDIKAPKGTKDILPEEVNSWQMIEQTALKIFSNANVKEIRTPVIEDTILFQRGVGESTDIVNKEMYTFSKSERSLTLRPENTAGVVRAYLEHNMHRLSSPVKLWYKGPMFRYERPQAGRQRQFHQIGVEIFGAEAPTADAECILLAVQFLNDLGLNDLTIELNSLGCDDCRKQFRERLKEHIKPKLNEFCEDCKNRYEKNPLRILDCKDEHCILLLNELNSEGKLNKIELCNECKEHFSTLQHYLDILEIKYNVNPYLVRGLDYYTRTVFEIKSNNLGSQNAVCGGGRYDNLVELIGGQHTPAVGWAMGVERLNSLINQTPSDKINFFVVTDYTEEAIKLSNKLRQKGFSVDYDFSSRKFSKQLEKAAKTANYAIIIGEDELLNNYYTIKDLLSSTQNKMTFDEICLKLNFR